MENIGLLIIFWYGILHAFGPDHLAAIADFSIGKNKRKTIMVTTLFAFGHGFSLLVFAKILESFHISDKLLGYGDIISEGIILGIGFYLLTMVFTNRININIHQHKDSKHLHIYFGKKHQHNSNKDITSAFTIGLLMGIGGVRGMLITLGFIENSSVDLWMVFAFTAGVMIIFLSFGACILYINQYLLHSIKTVRKVFAGAGFISVLVGFNMLIS